MRAWADDLTRRRQDVTAIGYFGSYARGDWGVGSDVDVVVLVDDSPLPFERRGVDFDASSLPVPADVLVYTDDEWAAATRRPGLARTAAREIVWVVRR